MNTQVKTVAWSDPLPFAASKFEIQGQGKVFGRQVAIVNELSDARLIAAAPDLLAALEEALDLVPRMSDNDPIAPALAEWCGNAREVLKKARGAA